MRPELVEVSISKIWRRFSSLFDDDYTIYTRLIMLKKASYSLQNLVTIIRNGFIGKVNLIDVDGTNLDDTRKNDNLSWD